METDQKIAKRAGQTLVCPRCSNLLTAAVEEGWEIDFCGQCKGVWVDIWAERELLGIKPAAFTMDELKRLHRSYKPLGRLKPVQYVSCPVCKELMNRKIWGTYSGIVIDKCFEHGTWFDEGELEKIREYVALGGMEYEKMRMMEDGFKELHFKIRREVGRLEQKIDSFRKQ
ncbi:MAG TPA: zf-TFIIB domain-containing protein [Candidatus Omnitrophota bacterium]|nr:zf-TFIIB domain-containing protein [Candidatus Omnitrophota bacterium]